MDLRSVLNTSDNGERKAVNASPTARRPPQPQPPQQHPHQHPHQPRPPQQPYGYRGEYPPQGSPGRHPSQDYPPHHAPPPHQGNYPPPQSPYQQQPPQHPGYPSRGGPQPPSNAFHDPRSPSGSHPPPSPYGAPAHGREPSGGYPFPPGQQQQPPELQSPGQRHQYPPAHYPKQRRDSHGQSNAAPSHPTTPYIQQQQQVPQTPPIVTPGAHSQPPYGQQPRSSHSTPTPTSAHSQHHFGPAPHGSPVGAPPGHAEYNRHPSQPPTPLGPPQQPGSRHSSYQQPASPYQSSKPPPGRDLQQQQQQQKSQPAAAQPPPAEQPHTSSRPTSRARHASQEITMQDAPSHARMLLDREPSMSVSPKTRVGSLPSNDGRAPPPEHDIKPAKAAIESDRERAARASTPAKRKLDDRSISPRELEHKHQRPPPGETNGRLESPTNKNRPTSSPAAPAPAPAPAAAAATATPATPAAPPRKLRKPRAEPPIWALDVSTLGKKPPKHANFVLQERIHSHINGGNKPGSVSVSNDVKVEPESQNGSPEVAKPQRASTAGVVVAEPTPTEVLGPWEATITGVKPYEEISKAIADFLFINVVNASDIQEIMGRGIQFEIEAKLGTLIDKDTNHRVQRSIESECILESSSRVAFRSSMTESQHKAFNDFLNHVVIQADPRAPHGDKRVQVHYKHRRELDRFYELPPDMQNRLPGCMRARLGQNRGRAVKVRVTHEQKTNEVLGKIIKARVADIDLHMPTCPMDCRISINLEMDWDGSVDELESLASAGERQPDRAKDRLSYKQGSYQVDLTQVTQTTSGAANNNRAEKEHELEIELAPDILIDQGRKAMSGGVHRYQELVEGFVDNVRVLARKARDFQ